MNAKLEAQIEARKMQAEERGIGDLAVHVVVQLGELPESTIGIQTDSSATLIPPHPNDRIYTEAPCVVNDQSITIRFRESAPMMECGNITRTQTVKISLGGKESIKAFLEGCDDDVVFSQRRHMLGLRGDDGRRITLGYIPGAWEQKLKREGLYANEEEDKSALMDSIREEEAARKVWGLEL